MAFGAVTARARAVHRRFVPLCAVAVELRRGHSVALCAAVLSAAATHSRQRRQRNAPDVLAHAKILRGMAMAWWSSMPMAMMAMCGALH